MKSIILAGGSGKRLWPLSRKSFPKQFLKLGKEGSLLQNTVRRLEKVTPLHDIYIVTNADYYHDVLKEVDLPKENILVEPEQKNTAPAIALAMKFLTEVKKISPQETLFITPADHTIQPVETFCGYVREGEKRAKRGELITFGIAPTKPETGYGYIQAEGEKVVEFVEKPDLKTALEYVLSGKYFWNSGMFLFSFEKMERELKQFVPEIGELLEGSYDEFLSKFKNLPSISIDYAVMEKAKEIGFIPLHLSWSDVGSWDNVYELLDKDEKGNVISGNVSAMETSRSLIFSSKRLVTTIGVTDLLIVETDDAILIAKKEEGQKVKEMVDELFQAGKSEAESHLTTHRPWGSYTILEEGTRYKIKRITVKPHEKLSLQLHYHRSEHWIVVTGTAKVTINDKEAIVHEGESIFVPKSSIHRVENPGKVSLEIIEVQVGEYLGEDDIVRLEDIYGRLKEDAAFNVLLRNG